MGKNRTIDPIAAILSRFEHRSYLLYRPILKAGIINAGGQSITVKGEGIHPGSIHFVRKRLHHPTQSIHHLHQRMPAFCTEGNRGALHKWIGVIGDQLFP